MKRVPVLALLAAFIFLVVATNHAVAATYAKESPPTLVPAAQTEVSGVIITHVVVYESPAIILAKPNNEAIAAAVSQEYIGAAAPLTMVRSRAPDINTTNKQLRRGTGFSQIPSFHIRL